MSGSSKKGIRTLNPYRIAAKLLLYRFAWDLRPESWQSRSRLKRLKNSISGGKAVVACNGPSLNKVDFSLLKGIFTIGMNKINLLFDRSDFRPDIIACVDPAIIRQNAEFYNETDINLFLEHGARKLIPSRPNITYLHTCHYPQASGDLSCSVYTGYTVTSVALQLAFHMGFRDVCVVGCDHNFSVQGQASAKHTTQKTDTDHFDPRYYVPGQVWNLPDYVQMEYSYNLIREMYAKEGGRVINCTEGGRLEVFPRASLTEWVSER
jgi:hypothetical protein